MDSKEQTVTNRDELISATKNDNVRHLPELQIALSLGEHLSEQPAGQTGIRTHGDRTGYVCQ